MIGVQRADSASVMAAAMLIAGPECRRSRVAADSFLAASSVLLQRRQRYGADGSDQVGLLVQTAAIAGQGIMMGDEITCAGALAAGQLVAPFSAKIKARGGYYLLRSRQRRPNPAMQAFTRWLNALFTVRSNKPGTRPAPTP